MEEWPSGLASLASSFSSLTKLLMAYWNPRPDYPLGPYSYPGIAQGVHVPVSVPVSVWQGHQPTRPEHDLEPDDVQQGKNH